MGSSEKALRTSKHRLEATEGQLNEKTAKTEEKKKERRRREAKGAVATPERWMAEKNAEMGRLRKSGIRVFIVGQTP